MPTGDTEKIIAWRLKCLSDESIKPPTTPDKNLAPKLKWIYNSKKVVELKGRSLKQDETTFTHGNVVNLFINYELDTFDCFIWAIGDRLVWAVTLTKNGIPKINMDIVVLDLMHVHNFHCRLVNKLNWCHFWRRQ